MDFWGAVFGVFLGVLEEGSSMTRKSVEQIFFGGGVGLENFMGRFVGVVLMDWIWRSGGQILWRSGVEWEELEISELEKLSNFKK